MSVTSATPQPEPDGSGRIKPVSNALARAKAAKKGNSAPIGKRTQATFPIQKPPRSKFVRVHPSTEYRMVNVLVLEDKDNNKIYYVSPDLELPEMVQNQTRLANLYAAQMSDGSFFIWYVLQSDTAWYRAARTAVRVATEKWIAVAARKSANSYDLIEPEDQIPEPKWTVLPSFAEMVEDAFSDAMITFTDHEMIRRLRGYQDDDDAE